MKNFLFSSVGDNTSFDKLFLGPGANYDVFIIYYGDNNDIYNKYQSKLKFIERRKGSKFQNFKYFYETYPDIIHNYDYFFILDDDIIIDIPKINMMFELANKYSLKICAPSFTPQSKISHSITAQKKDVLLTYTNFVEVNTPLFNKDALINLMKVLDNALIGWGIDYLYIWCNGLHDRNSYAIIHSINCTNPTTDNKKIKRYELSNVNKYDRRKQIWKDYSKKIGCPDRFDPINYTSIMALSSSRGEVSEPKVPAVSLRPTYLPRLLGYLQSPSKLRPHVAAGQQTVKEVVYE